MQKKKYLDHVHTEFRYTIKYETLERIKNPVFVLIFQTLFFQYSHKKFTLISHENNNNREILIKINYKDENKSKKKKKNYILIEFFQ